MSKVEGNSAKFSAAHRRAARGYQERHRQRGLCVTCPRPALPGRIHCVGHAERRTRRPYRRWLPAEDSILRAAWLQRINVSEIAAKLRRPMVAVRRRARRLGLPPREVRRASSVAQKEWYEAQKQNVESVVWVRT